MSSRSARSAEVVRARPNEGVLVPLTKRLVPHVSGTNLYEVSISLADAPVPDRRYHADVAQVFEVDESSICLAFAQRRVVGAGLRSLVLVTMTPDSVRHFLGTCTTFLPAIEDFIARNDIPPGVLQQIAEEPEHTVSLVANIVAAAQSARESALDFFHLSPWGTRDLQSRSTVPLDPIVRIDLSTPLLVALLRHLKAMEARLPKEAK